MQTFATPILASALWQAHRQRTARPKTPLEHGITPERFDKISTQNRVVDEVLAGGLEYGRIHGITAQHQPSVDGLLRRLIQRHLLDSVAAGGGEAGRAGVIVVESALEALDVRRLHEGLERGIAERGREGEGSGDASKMKAMTGLHLLDLVKIMKVFDCVGLAEAVTEVTGNLEEHVGGNGVEGDVEGRKGNTSAPERHLVRGKAPSTAVATDSARHEDKFPACITIDDSEDEAGAEIEVDEDEDEEMLDHRSLEREACPSIHSATIITTASTAEEGMAGCAKPDPICISSPALSESSPRPHFPNGLLVINNLSHIIGPQLKDNYVRGQAMLADFLRSLRHLTQAYNLCTVVVGHSIGLTTTGPTQGGRRGGESSATTSMASSLSLFHASTVRSVLGTSWGYALDTHLLMHSVRFARSEDGAGDAGWEKEMVEVVEVVQDRYGGRLGRWTPLVIDKQGSLV